MTFFQFQRSDDVHMSGRIVKTFRRRSLCLSMQRRWECQILIRIDFEGTRWHEVGCVRSLSSYVMEEAEMYLISWVWSVVRTSRIRGEYGIKWNWFHIRDDRVYEGLIFKFTVVVGSSVVSCILSSSLSKYRMDWALKFNNESWWFTSTSPRRMSDSRNFIGIDQTEIYLFRVSRTIVYN